jgi:hypothetical protein
MRGRTAYTVNPPEERVPTLATQLGLVAAPENLLKDTPIVLGSLLRGKSQASHKPVSDILVWGSSHESLGG